MASWYPRRGNCITVYFYDKVSQKLSTLPRSQTKHLDGKPEAEIDAWVNTWAEENGHKVHRALKHSLRDSDELTILWNEFQDFVQEIKKIETKTRDARDSDFYLYVVPYFVERCGEKDVRNWYKHVKKFTLFISAESGLKNPVDRKKKIWLVRRFGEYLVTSNILSQPWVLVMPSTKVKPKTPLRVRRDPEEILSMARRLLAKADEPRPRTMTTPSGKVVGLTKTRFSNDKLMALSLVIGYFASLGPGEVYGLYKEDFLTGAFAKQVVEATHSELQKHGLGSGMTISVERQLGDASIEKYVKNDYRCGPVNVWDVEAARLIASIIKEMPSGRLFPLSRGRLDKLHGKHIKSVLQLTAHDLRRSSALHLGRTVKLTLETLQKHLRHAEIETTMLYIREPEVSQQKNLERQDFDDVG